MGSDPPQSACASLVVIGIDGKHVMRCAWTFPEGRTNGEIDRFVWSRDGTSLYYLQTSPKAVIRRVFVSTGRIDTLPLPPELHLDGTDNRILGFTGANSALIGSADFSSDAKSAQQLLVELSRPAAEP